MERVYPQSAITEVARELLASLIPAAGATIIGLVGDLGTGKTTLTQAIARTLGITETVVSPTFMIAKFYPTSSAYPWRQLVHVDAYRIDEEKELDPLGWDTLLQTSETLIVVEWPERIKGRLPLQTTFFTITHEPNARRITRLSSL